jgi:hypothetical protein
MKYLVGLESELLEVKKDIEAKLGYPTAHLKTYSEVVVLPTGERALMLPRALNALGVTLDVEKLLPQAVRARVLLASQLPKPAQPRKL